MYPCVCDAGLPKNDSMSCPSPKARLAKIKPNTAPPRKVLQGTELMEFMDVSLLDWREDLRWFYDVNRLCFMFPRT